MAINSSVLILSGTLLLSQSHPIEFSKPASETWFSDPKLVDVAALQHKIIVRAKAQGLLHASGLDSSNTELSRLLVVSDENYSALKRCPQLPIDLTQSVPAWTGSLKSFRALAPTCHFESLGLKTETLADSEFIEIESRLKSKGYLIRSVRWNDRQKRQIEISSSKSELLNTAPTLLREIGPLAPFYDIAFRDSPRPGRTLIFQLTLFEFSRSRAQSLGLRLPRALDFKSTLGPKAGLQVLDGSFQVGADFGETQGFGHILARPQVRTKPGEKALFQSGGEIPIRQVGPYSSSTQWKNYGLILHLEPDAAIETGSPEISLGLDIELSEPDMGTAVDGVPGMTLRKLGSRFDLRIDETTILSTMIQTRSGTQRNGVAGFSRIPLLGDLIFGAHSDFEQDSELWFAMRPTWDEIPAAALEGRTQNAKLGL